MPRPVIYFVRHGETDWNAEKRLQGQRDIPLNALGRAQASRCGEVLRDLLSGSGHAAAGLDYVSSPLGRARETMERLRTALGLDPASYRTDDRLKEMSFGRWEGYTFPELAAREAEALAARERNAWGFVVPDGESYELLEARVAAWYASLEADCVVAAHGGVCRVLMAHLRVPGQERITAGTIGQGCVYVFDGAAMTRHG